MQTWALSAIKVLFGLAMLIGLSTYLCGSATHSSHVLNYYINDQQHAQAYQGLWPAAKNGASNSLDQLVELAFINNDEYWLQQAASLNHLQAQLYLAELASSEQTQQYWWRQAAQNGHSPSLFELFLVENDTSKRVEYLNQAAQLNYPAAVIALSKYWYDSGNQKQALYWLSKASHYDKYSEFLLARLLWSTGEHTQAKKHFSAAAEFITEAKDYALLSESMQQKGLESLAQQHDHFSEQCAQQLQFVATTLDSAVQATQFMKSFQKDSRFKDMPICINKVIWLKPKELQCDLVDHRQRCDLSRLASKMFTPSYTHLVLFLPTGTAYVQHGLMHLDQADTYSVFVHELAHFVGFLDEYAILPALAQQHCYQNNAPNLLIGDNIYASATFADWQKYAENLSPAEYNEADVTEQSEPTIDTNTVSGLEMSESRTCSKLDINGYKPSSGITFLEHHDTEYIPAIYLLIWKDLLLNSYQNVAIEEHFYNIAMEKNLPIISDYWLGVEPIESDTQYID